MAKRLPGLSRALGLTNKPRPSSKRLASVSHEALRRASPSENILMGYSPKARRYVKTDARKITKATASVSARQAETKRVRKVYGMASPERATDARRHGALSYESAAQGARVAKANQTRVLKRVERAGASREKIPYDPGKRRDRQKQKAIVLKPGDGERYRDLRKRRLRGEWFDIVDFVWLMDVGQYFADPQSVLLRQSPDARGTDFIDH
jgi:hypothetical protein